MNKKFLVILFILIIFTQLSYALDPEERAYFDAQNEKVVARLNSKMDTESLKIEQSMKNEFHESTLFLQKELHTFIKRAVWTLGIGLSGALIIILTIFKLIDLRITHTRNIQKYEEELKSKILELDKYKNELDLYKESLINYQKVNYHQIQPQQPNLEKNLVKKTNSLSFIFTFIKIIMFIFIILAISYFIYHKFIIKA